MAFSLKQKTSMQGAHIAMSHTGVLLSEASRNWRLIATHRDELFDVVSALNYQFRGWEFNSPPWQENLPKFLSAPLAPCGKLG